jgi:hypothetical protein
MTVQRFRRHFPEQRMAPCASFAAIAVLDLISIGLVLAIAYAGRAILKFVGWL